MGQRSRQSEPLALGEVAPVFERLFKAPIALAVSGGADSTALLHLVATWRLGGGVVPAVGPVPPVTVLTVDHGLRPESAEEAAFVSGRCAQLGLPHATLRWEGCKPVTGIAEAARHARYDLLARQSLDEARTIGLSRLRSIVTAHHRDDVAETFLIRLARGSGLEGLAGLAERAQWPPEGLSLDGSPAVPILRPLLAFPKDRLIATLAKAGVGWREDPSNRDHRFERARVRALLERLGTVGLGAETIAESATRLRRAEAAIDASVEALIRRAVTGFPTGEAKVVLRALDEVEDEIACRLLARIVRAVRGSIWPPRLGRVEDALRQLRRSGAPGSLSLGGCVLAPDRRSNDLLIVREVRRGGLPQILVRPGETASWDERFAVALASTASGPVSVRGLARAEWRGQVSKDGGALAGRLSERVALALPAVFSDGRLISLGGLSIGTESASSVSVECCLSRRLGAR